MTTVSFLVEQARIVGFDVQGHSGWGQEGEDIVCAAVTSAIRLVECTVNDVMGLLGSPCCIQPFSGHLQQFSGIVASEQRNTSLPQNLFQKNIPASAFRS